MKTTQPWRELRWISCRILHQWCEEKMQKWGNTNSLYLQCILKSYGVCAQPNVAIPWCKWSATFHHFRLASFRFTGTGQRQHRSCVHHRKKSTLISWRKIPPPWRHWCPGTQKWQNPDIFNGLKHSMCAAETMLSDGTFYSRTKLLTQIYTLHAPLWALPNKIDGTYSRFFALLKYVQYVNSSLSYRLNIGNWTSISM